MIKQLDFHFLNDQLLNLGAVHSASELQGYLCGLVSGGKHLIASEWLSASLAFLDLTDIVPEDTLDIVPEDTLNDDQRKLFNDIYTITLAQLSDTEYVFTPMLPDETSSIERRIDELGCWCQGFLHGVGASGLGGDNTMTPESSEALRDLAQISQVSVDDESNDAENEANWTELVEYVRAAVMVFYTDIAQSKIATANANQIKVIH